MEAVGPETLVDSPPSDIFPGGPENVANNSVKLDGKVLQAPDIKYKSIQDQKNIKPSDGSWNMKGVKYLRGVQISSWVLLNLANSSFCNAVAVDKFINFLCNTASDQGISMPQPSSTEIVNESQTSSIEDALRNCKEKYNAELVIVVLRYRKYGSREMYSKVKKAAETILNLVTQCIFDTTLVRKCVPQVVSNICQKINAKLGGVNHSLVSAELYHIMKEPIMIVGASVSNFCPTIASVVASLDRHPSRCAVSVRVQNSVLGKKSIEAIADLQNMMEDLLKSFYRHTHQKPRRIVFYREGVCDSQFENVREHEVMSVRKACKMMQEEGYEPGITYIAVQKRHRTRFLPQDSRDGVGRLRNIPPGTVVDGTSTNPLTNFDFFLASQFTNQGLSRPCHYIVLLDDNKFSKEDLQNLTFHLCHAYARSTSSVSRPAPLLYANLAAKRALRHIRATLEEESNSVERREASVDHILETLNEKIKVMDGLADTMYFV